MQSTFDAIVHAHRIIRDAVTRIASTESRAEVLLALRELARILPDHFAWEERPGAYFARLERIHADGARLVAELVGEHRQMLADLPVLLEAGDDLVPRARRLAARLRAHEQREARLGLELELGEEL